MSSLPITPQGTNFWPARPQDLTLRVHRPVLTRLFLAFFLKVFIRVCLLPQVNETQNHPSGEGDRPEETRRRPPAAQPTPTLWPKPPTSLHRLTGSYPPLPWPRYDTKILPQKELKPRSHHVGHLYGHVSLRRMRNLFFFLRRMRNLKPTSTSNDQGFPI